MQVSDRSRASLVYGGLFIFIGIGFLLASEGIVSFRTSFIWPLILIAIGLNYLLGRSTRERMERVRSRQLATAEERVRIARELHDIVAHSVSVMTVQIAAARRVASKDPAAAETALASAEDTGRQSLDELRRIVNVLRAGGSAAYEPAPSEPLPGLTNIPKLVNGMREANLDVTLTLEGEAPEVSPSVGLAAYRVMQEALTNVLRHAPKANVKALVSYDPDEIELQIVDDGEGVDEERTPSVGHGIVGMRERVAAVGGRVDVGPDNGGWMVHAFIPISGR